MKRYFAYLLLFVSVGYGQTYEVKDRSGIVLLKISNIKMFRYSNYFKEDIPVFQATVANVAGEKLLGVSVAGTVRKKDGSIVKFSLDSICKDRSCDLEKDSVHNATFPFLQPWPFSQADIQSVEFSLAAAKHLRTIEGFHVSGFIAKDEGCLSDYIDTKSLAGLALRKKLVELVEFGCGFIVDKPISAILLPSTKKTVGTGTKKSTVIQVFLRDEGVFVGLDPSPHSLKDGWIATSALVPGKVLTTEDLVVVGK